VRDILTFPLLEDATLALMDIDAERLDFARRSVQRIVDMGGYPAKVEATMDRAEALRGADAVLCDHPGRRHPGLAARHRDPQEVRGGHQHRRHARSRRHLPRPAHHPGDAGHRPGHGALLPDATMLNYTNPMAMLCRAMQRETFIRLTGLCHSVQGTAMMLAGWIGAPYEEITYTCAGINHMAWYSSSSGTARTPIPSSARRSPSDRRSTNEEIVRNEMFLALDYYVTESSGTTPSTTPGSASGPT
jgi:alpha-galactosidase